MTLPKRSKKRQAEIDSGAYQPPKRKPMTHPEVGHSFTTPPSKMSTKELIEKYGRAELGIDGNCGFALLGPNIQEGEAEFVQVHDMSDPHSQREAAYQALAALRTKLEQPKLSYFLSTSHPFYA